MNIKDSSIFDSEFYLILTFESEFLEIPDDDKNEYIENNIYKLATNKNLLKKSYTK